MVKYKTNMDSPLHITQHKRFVYYGIHQNPSLPLRISFMLGTIDYLLSWNFKHIVRKRARDIVRMVNTSNNLRQIKIMTPAELL